MKILHDLLNSKLHFIPHLWTPLSSQPARFLSIVTFVNVSRQAEAHSFSPRTCISIKCKKISGGRGEGIEHVLILFFLSLCLPARIQKPNQIFLNILSECYFPSRKVIAFSQLSSWNSGSGRSRSAHGDSQWDVQTQHKPEPSRGRLCDCSSGSHTSWKAESPKSICGWGASSVKRGGG